MTTQQCNPSDVNLMNKLTHCNNLDRLIMQMENGLKEFKERAPHRKDFIDTTEQGITDLKEMQVFLNNVYKRMEEMGGASLTERYANYKLAAENEALKKENEVLKQQYEGLLKFDNNK